MKKFFILFAIMIALTFSNANAKSSTMVGGGVGYGLDIEELAIQAGAVFDIDAPVMIAPDFKYYLISSDVPDVSSSAWELNVNAQYSFAKKKDMSFFAIGGLQYANYSSEYTGPGAEFFPSFATGASYSRIGINLGVGADFDFNGFHLLPELKFTVAGNEQLFIGASAMFPI